MYILIMNLIKELIVPAISLIFYQNCLYIGVGTKGGEWKGDNPPLVSFKKFVIR